MSLRYYFLLVVGVTVALVSWGGFFFETTLIKERIGVLYQDVHILYDEMLENERK